MIPGCRGLKSHAHPVAAFDGLAEYRQNLPMLVSPGVRPTLSAFSLASEPGRFASAGSRTRLSSSRYLYSVARFETLRSAPTPDNAVILTLRRSPS